MLSISEEITLSTKKLKAIVNDARKTAKAIDLVYVDDRQPGITRKKKG